MGDNVATQMHRCLEGDRASIFKASQQLFGCKDFKFCEEVFMPRFQEP